MKLRLTSPASVIDINRIPRLSYVREEEGRIAIGALTRHDEIATNPLIRSRCVLLAEAASVIADQQVRNRGSIGGSLAHADPSADIPTACTALDAEIEIKSKKGSRTVPTSDFFVDAFTTALLQGEIIEGIRVPIPSPRSGGAYTKLTKGHNDFALAAVAVQCSLDTDGVCENVNVVLGGVASKPTHATETENTFRDRKVDDRVMREAVLEIDDGYSPLPDPRVSPELKRKMTRLLVERTLRVAFNRAREAS
jgi:carbon-monoxide dehydrogenase medium subunit